MGGIGSGGARTGSGRKNIDATPRTYKIPLAHKSKVIEEFKAVLSKYRLLILASRSKGDKRNEYLERSKAEASKLRELNSVDRKY